MFVTGHDDGTVDVFTAGRRMRVAVSPAVEAGDLRRGQSVRLNEALTVVEVSGFEATGEVCALREILSGGERPSWWGTPTRSAWSGSPTPSHPGR